MTNAEPRRILRDLAGSTKLQNAALLAARLLLAGLFVPSGYSTLGNIGGSAAYFASLGLPVPPVTAWAVGLFELGGGMLLLAGLQTRAVSLLFAGFCALTAIIGHAGQGGDDAMVVLMHKQALMKDLAISGGFLALLVAGAGDWSLDALRGRLSSSR